MRLSLVSFLSLMRDWWHFENVGCITNILLLNNLSPEVVKDHERCQEMVGLCVFEAFFCDNNNTWPLVIHGLECCQWRNFQIRKDQKLLWMRLICSLNDINIAIYLWNENLWYLFDLRLTCCWHVSVFFMYLAHSALLHHTKAGSEWVKF